jgi:prepilin-type N-terminal cleavage/methylation domain-containing protein/prepilin-type processing-associated H-X9-DG protein
MRTRAGFTLLELVVALGIIGLLVALVTVAAQSARETTHSTVCQNRLRQIGTLLNARLIERDGRMPTLFNRESKNDNRPAIDTVLGGPGVGEQIFACPADDQNLFERTGTSYFWNFTVNGQPVSNLFSVVGGDQASQIPLLTDKEGFHPDAPDGVNVLYADGHASGELSFVSELESDPAQEVSP